MNTNHPNKTPQRLEGCQENMDEAREGKKSKVKRQKGK